MDSGSRKGTAGGRKFLSGIEAGRAGDHSCQILDKRDRKASSIYPDSFWIQRTADEAHCCKNGSICREGVGRVAISIPTFPTP